MTLAEEISAHPLAPERPLMSWARALLIGWTALLLNQFARDGQRRPGPQQGPAREKQPAVDRYGDPLPAGAVARLGTLRVRHDGTARALAYSPDGKILAGSCAGKIILWEAATGKRLRQLPIGAAGWLSRRALAFSPDSKVLAVAHGKHLHTAAVIGEKFRNEISFWDVASGRYLRSFKSRDVGLASSLCFSPDGKSLALGGVGPRFYVWEAATGKELWKTTLPGGTFGDFVFSPDSKCLALITHRRREEVELWDAATGKPLRTVEHPKNDGIAAVAFAPDGKTLASATMDRLFLWEVATGKEQARMEAKVGYTRGLAFTPDGKTLVSASYDTRAHVWDVEKRALRRSLGRPLATAGSCLALSPDGRTAAVGTHYSKIHFWDVASGKELFTDFQGPDSWIRCLAFSPDGSVLACGGDLRKVQLWDAKTWKPLRDLGGNAQSLSFAPDGKRLAGVPFVPTNFHTHAGAEKHKPISVWDLSTGKASTPVPNKGPGNIDWVAFCRGGKALASFGVGQLAFWDAATGRQLDPVSPQGFPPLFQGFPSPMGPVVTPDGRTAVLVGGTGLSRHAPPPSTRVIDLDSGKKRLAFPAGGAGVAVSPNGKTLALGERYLGAGLWDLVLGKKILGFGKRFGTHSRPVSLLALSPDGRWLASAAGFPQFTGDIPGVPRIKLWDLRTGEEAASFQGEGGFVGSLTFSPDGTRLVSGMCNGSVLVWDVAAAVRKLKARTGNLTAKELDALWHDLTGQDATKAHKALWALVAVPAQTVPFLKEQLLPKPKVGPEKIRQWIADLDSATFSVRDRASRRLRELGPQAEIPLSKALNGKLSLETRRRLEALLQSVQPTPADLLRSRRAIQVLEHIGTPEARQVLHSFAAGTPSAIRTREAKASLERLARQTAASP
jgi:WD40 repeat protein